MSRHCCKQQQYFYTIKSCMLWLHPSAEESRIVEFNPWGRPGGGAPIRDRQGNMLNDYNTRKVGWNPLPFKLLVN